MSYKDDLAALPISVKERLSALPDWSKAGHPHRVEADLVAALSRLALAQSAIRWCMDNCDHSAAWNFGTDGVEMLEDVIAELESPGGPS